MELYKFGTAYTQLRELYGIELNPDEFETLGLIGWEKIGNKRYQLKSISVIIDNGLIHLPCDADVVEAVYANTPDYQMTDNLDTMPLYYNQAIEQYIEMRKGNNKSGLYTRGKFVKYQVVGQHTLETSMADGTVYVLYKTTQYDEQGLPLLTLKEVDGVAAYCAYADTFKKSLMTRDQATLQMAMLLEQKWLKLCSQARMPMSFSQNDFDAIGDVIYGWDRKSYGKSLKPIK